MEEKDLRHLKAFSIFIFLLLFLKKKTKRIKKVAFLTKVVTVLIKQNIDKIPRFLILYIKKKKIQNNSLKPSMDFKSIIYYKM